MYILYTYYTIHNIKNRVKITIYAYVNVCGVVTLRQAVAVVLAIITHLKRDILIQ